MEETGIILSVIAMALAGTVVLIQVRLGRRTARLRTALDAISSGSVGAEKRVGLQQVHQSIHHLFQDRDLLRPRGGGHVDMILDAADLPSDLDAYLQQVADEGARARVLVLDPSSALIERHRFAMPGEGDSKAAVEHIRAKIQQAIDRIRPLATVRLYDAMPPGNLIIVDDHIFWGGLPGIPTDVALPVVSLTANTREHVYWAFRRNFDDLWKRAAPSDTGATRTTRSIAASL